MVAIASPGSINPVTASHAGEEHMKNRSSFLKTTLSIVGGALTLASGAAFAQAPAAPAGSDEIVVTAQRRSERLVDVPITVTAVSSEALDNAGIDATGGLAQVVPAFRMDYDGTFSQPSIRGVGTAVATAGGGSNVGMYVDGFLIPSPLTSDFSFLNTQSVQVLKGPQGALFGRNTTGGAVLVTTADPTVDPALQLKASYARFNEVNVGAYGSTGLTPNFAVDLGVLYNSGDGFITNTINNDDKFGAHETIAIRVGALWDVTEDLSVLLRYSHTRRDDPSAYLYGALPTSEIRRYAAGDTLTPLLFGGQALTLGALIPGSTWSTTRGNVTLTPTNGAVTHVSEVDMATARIEYDLGWATLSSRTMYRDQSTDKNSLDLDSSSFAALAVDIPGTDKTFTQEFLLAGKSDRWDWVAGLFYMNQKATQTLGFIDVFGAAFSPHALNWAGGTEITASAAFGDVTYRVTDRLSLTGGVRVSKEENNAYWKRELGPAPLFCGLVVDPTIGCGVTFRASDDWTDTSPRVVARYALTDRSNVYASWSRGFKSGFIDENGFNPVPIDPETIQAYEVGYKYAGEGARLETSLFYYDYTDLQLSSYVGTQSITTNAASSEIYGAEVSGAFDLTDKLTASGGLAYTHSEYTSFPGAPVFRFDGVAGTFGFAPTENVSGNQMRRSPEWSGNVALDYTTPLHGGELGLSTNLHYASEVFFDPANQFSQDGYALLSANARWTTPSGKWTFAVSGENITDEEYLTQVLTGIVGAQTTFGAPATWAVSLAYKY